MRLAKGKWEIQTVADVDRHNGYPAIRIKLQPFGDVRAVRRRFDCTEEVAQQALSQCYDAAADEFWQWAEMYAGWKLGKKPIAFLNDGWLCVQDMPARWSGPTLAKWRTFRDHILGLVDRLLDTYHILGEIHENGWAVDDSPEYDFTDPDEGDDPREPVEHCRTGEGRDKGFFSWNEL